MKQDRIGFVQCLAASRLIIDSTRTRLAEFYPGDTFTSDEQFAIQQLFTSLENMSNCLGQLSEILGSKIGERN